VIALKAIMLSVSNRHASIYFGIIPAYELMGSL